MLYRPGVHGGQDFTTRRNPQLFPWLLHMATKIRISLLRNPLAGNSFYVPKLHLPSRNLHYARSQLQTSVTNPPTPLICGIFDTKFLDNVSFFPRTKIRKEKKRKNPRVGVFITRQSSNPDFLPSFLYYLRRDDFTKLNFCRPTVNNDNSRPSLSAPAEARQRRKLWLF